MFRIDSPTAAAVLPTPQAPGAPGYFAYAPAGSGNIPTVVTSDFLNGVQEELIAILTYAGIIPSKTNNAQVLAAILSLLDSAAPGSGGDIFGYILSNTAANPTTHITAAAGQCRDSTNTSTLANPTPFTKRLDQVWAAGSDNGGRLSGTLANGQSWHFYVILNPTTGAIDFGFDQSATAPTLPTGFTKFRRLGAVVLEAASTAIRQFIQTGDWFRLKTRSADYAVQSNGGGPFLRQITVPAGIKVEAEIYFQSTGSVAVTPAYLSGMYDPDFGAPPAFGGSTQWAQVRRTGFLDSNSTGASYGAVFVRVFTDTARQIYTYSNDSLDVIALGVLGWRDERGKFF